MSPTGRPEGEYRSAKREGSPVSAAAHPLALPELAAYGLFAMPLAMVALPLYVQLPQLYGGSLGVDLAALGTLLLILRLADGVIDPLRGAWSDHLASRKLPMAAAAPVLALGMIALFVPIPRGQASLLVWLGVTLAFVHLAFSVAAISHNAWGAELSADSVEMTRITALREGLALIGVVVASVAPSLLGTAGEPESGPRVFAFVFAGLVLLCAIVMLRAPAGVRPVRSGTSVVRGLRVPLDDALFRRLLVVFLANGIASAVPATLFLFFVADVLRAAPQQGLFLALYFIAGALGMPLWVRLATRVGKVRAWGVGMAAAIVAFGWASALGPGDRIEFATICVVSGLALGADLALPPSILADVIGRRGATHDAGAYFGLWTLAPKLNLALAAGIALPLVAALGYVPGSRDPAALSALAFVYAAVPCLLKMGAGVALARFDIATRRST